MSGGLHGQAPMHTMGEYTSLACRHGGIIMMLCIPHQSSPSLCRLADSKPDNALHSALPNNGACMIAEQTSLGLT